MAKQVLDLYELFNLVIARGGLVEVINKKLWQEVIKGLGLPSSITSAAFTLRTQWVWILQRRRSPGLPIKKINLAFLPGNGMNTKANNMCCKIALDHGMGNRYISANHGKFSHVVKVEQSFYLWLLFQCTIAKGKERRSIAFSVGHFPVSWLTEIARHYRNGWAGKTAY